MLDVAHYTLASGWNRLESTPTPRQYHATMLLLPDGRVFVGGGDLRLTASSGTPDPHDYDIFEPPYLLTGQPRPSEVALSGVTQDPDGTYVLLNNQVGINCEVVLEGLTYFDRIVLIAPGSITHHSDMSARYVEMVSTAVSTKERTFSTPDQRVLPHGYYMLFAVSSGGIPSEAIWVRVQ